MRIVNRSEFLRLAEGVMYVKHQKRVGLENEICIKGETCGSDWLYQNLFELDANDAGEMFDMLDKAEQDSSYHVTLDFECGSRDGMYDDEDMFAIFDKNEVGKLFELIESTYKKYPEVD